MTGSVKNDIFMEAIENTHHGDEALVKVYATKGGFEDPDNKTKGFEKMVELTVCYHKLRKTFDQEKRSSTVPTEYLVIGFHPMMKVTPDLIQKLLTGKELDEVELNLAEFDSSGEVKGHTTLTLKKVVIMGHVTNNFSKVGPIALFLCTCEEMKHANTKHSTETSYNFAKKSE